MWGFNQSAQQNELVLAGNENSKNG
uniref:Uncharacterized protein n=1 Tax=Rhizophora mucronata TaxID=61149 RepID=A0A2P2QE06_RHIMU